MKTLNSLKTMKPSFNNSPPSQAMLRAVHHPATSPTSPTSPEERSAEQQSVFRLTMTEHLTNNSEDFFFRLFVVFFSAFCHFISAR